VKPADAVRAANTQTNNYHRTVAFSSSGFALQCGAQVMHKQIVSCLVDLLENPGARSWFLDWRSKKDMDQCAVRLLLKLWAVYLDDEPVAVPPKLQPDGERMSCGEFVDQLTAQNMHTKIFALLSKVNFDCRDGLAFEDKMLLLQVR
jgi:hypothetical protein